LTILLKKVLMRCSEGVLENCVYTAILQRRSHCA
jgi:hypothetical protein